MNSFHWGVARGSDLEVTEVQQATAEFTADLDRVLMLKSAMQNEKIKSFNKCETEEQLDFWKQHNCCVLCGDRLELRHLIEPDRTVIENAFCPGCEIRTRTSQHLIF